MSDVWIELTGWQVLAFMGGVFAAGFFGAMFRDWRGKRRHFILLTPMSKDVWIAECKCGYVSEPRDLMAASTMAGAHIGSHTGIGRS